MVDKGVNNEWQEMLKLFTRNETDNQGLGNSRLKVVYILSNVSFSVKTFTHDRAREALPVNSR